MPLSSRGELVRCRPWLGTFVTVRAGGDSAVREHAVESAFDIVARIHSLMSAHEIASEVGTLNRFACDTPVVVSQETRDVLVAAREIHLASDGVFDIAVAGMLMRAGMLPEYGVPGNGTTADIELRPDGSVRFRKPMRVDLGGIAKGFAVDRAVASLRRSGVTAGVVEAGGDLRVFGRAERVHVRHPNMPSATFPLLDVRDMAVATSAGYYSPLGAGRAGAAIVNPATGRFSKRRVSVTVIAPTCIVADALTKVVFLVGPSATPVLRHFNAHAAIVDQDGRVRYLAHSDAA